jgi:hypothetical protein
MWCQTWWYVPAILIDGKALIGGSWFVVNASKILASLEVEVGGLRIQDVRSYLKNKLNSKRDGMWIQR